MKKIFFTILLIFIHFVGFSQSSLANFVNNISKKYKVKVALDPSLLENQNVFIDESPKSFEDIFSMLNKAGLDYYTISDSYILLRLKDRKTTQMPGQTQPLYKKISGRLLDEKTKLPLSYASVYLTDMTEGTTTDEDGRFTINIPHNTSALLECSYLGYEKKQMELDGNKMNVSLKQEESTIEEVTIVASTLKNLELGQIKNQSDFQSYKILNYNSNDLAKTAQISLAGVSRTDNAQMSIRNMKYDKTLSVVNNIPMLKSGHYFNLISNFNELYFNEIDVYKNIFPPQHGSALGGMIQYNNNYNKHKNSLRTTTNLLYSGIAATYHFDKFSVNVGARKSYIQFSKYGILENNLYQLKTPFNNNEAIQSSIPDVDFYDVNYQLDYNYKNGGKLTFGAVHTTDNDKINWTTEKQFLLFAKSLELKQSYYNSNENKTSGYSVSNQLPFGRRVRWHVDGHLYHYRDVFGLSNISKEFFDGKNRTFENNYNQEQLIKTKSINNEFKYQINSSTNILLGGLIKSVELDFTGKEDNKSIVGLAQKANQYTGYSEYNNSTESSQIKAGIKLTKFTNLDNLYLEPYLSYSKKLGKGLHIKSSYAYRVQNLNVLDYETRFSQNLNYYYLSNDTFDIQRGHHFMIGGMVKKGNFSFDVEGYAYRNYGNLLLTNLFQQFKIDRNNPIPNKDDTYKFFTGVNNIIGLDLMLCYKIGTFSSAINYTLSKNTQRFKEIYRDKEIPAPTDRRHQLSFNTSYEIDRWTFSYLMSYMSGSPYLSYANVKEKGPKKELNRKEVIEYLPDYFSLDMGFDYALVLKPININVGLSVSNITNNTNVKFVHQTGRFDQEKESKPIITGNQALMLGRVFNFNIKMKL